jgi:hypothetical protein
VGSVVGFPVGLFVCRKVGCSLGENDKVFEGTGEGVGVDKDEGSKLGTCDIDIVSMG